MQFDEMTEHYIANTDWIGDMDDVVPDDIRRMEIEAEEQAEKELQARIPSEETYVDRKGDMLAVGDWVYVHWKLKRDDKWEDYFIEAKVVEILPPDGDFDDEAMKPVVWPASIQVEYFEDGALIQEGFNCEYEYYENRHICHDIEIKEF